MIVRSFAFSVGLSAQYLGLFVLASIALDHKGIHAAPSKTPEQSAILEPDILAQTVGKWSTRREFWKEPGTPAEITEGSSKIEAFDTYGLKESCTRKTSEGPEIKAEIKISYDSKQKAHMMHLKDEVESLGPLNLDLKGTFDRDKKAFIFSGTIKNGNSHQKDKPSDSNSPVKKATPDHPIKVIIKNIRPDSFKKELWIARLDGRERKVLAVEYRR